MGSAPRILANSEMPQPMWRADAIKLKTAHNENHRNSLS